MLGRWTLQTGKTDAGGIWSSPPTATHNFALAANPASFAGSYRQAYAGLLEIAAEKGTVKGEVEKLRCLKQRAWRATLIARQLVPPGEDQEETYCEHELATILMGECRDLPPGYDQLRRQPVRDDRFLWSYREAALVSHMTPPPPPTTTHKHTHTYFYSSFTKMGLEKPSRSKADK